MKSSVHRNTEGNAILRESLLSVMISCKNVRISILHQTNGFPTQHSDAKNGIMGARVPVGGPGAPSCHRLNNLGLWFKYGELPLIAYHGAITPIILGFA